MGRRPEQAFFQRRHTGGQQTHEKMLSISNRQKNDNQILNYFVQNNVKESEYDKALGEN